MTPKLVTASWGALYAHRDQLDVTPVRISRGVPKFWPAAEGFTAIELLMPDGWMFKLEGESFFRSYRQKLDAAGTSAVMDAFDAIPGDRSIALACFEPFGGPPCHRHEFGRWWTTETGELIDEWQPEPAQLRLLDHTNAPTTGAEGT